MTRLNDSDSKTRRDFNKGCVMQRLLLFKVEIQIFFYRLRAHANQNKEVALVLLSPLSKENVER